MGWDFALIKTVCLHLKTGLLSFQWDMLDTPHLSFELVGCDVHMYFGWKRPWDTMRCMLYVWVFIVCYRYISHEQVWTILPHVAWPEIMSSGASKEGGAELCRQIHTYYGKRDNLCGGGHFMAKLTTTNKQLTYAYGLSTARYRSRYQFRTPI